MDNQPFVPTKKNASYGALLSIALILAIVIVGAFYVAGQRVKQNATPIVLPEATTTATSPQV
jgi:hypothetical protein